MSSIHALPDPLATLKGAKDNAKIKARLNGLRFDLTCPLCQKVQSTNETWLEHIEKHLEDLEKHHLTLAVAALCESNTRDAKKAAAIKSARGGEERQRVGDERAPDVDAVPAKYNGEPSSVDQGDTSPRHSTIYTLKNVAKSNESNHAPPYTRAHQRDIDSRTIRYYDLPYEYDRDNLSYIIIQRSLSNSEIEVLFEHTRRLRSPEKDKPTYPRVHIRWLSEESLKQSRLEYELNPEDPNSWTVFLPIGDPGTDRKLDNLFAHTQALIDEGMYCPRECMFSGCEVWFTSRSALIKHQKREGHCAFERSPEDGLDEARINPNREVSSQVRLEDIVEENDGSAISSFDGDGVRDENTAKTLGGEGLAENGPESDPESWDIVTDVVGPAWKA